MHMKKEAYEGGVWEIETSHGTTFIPADVVGTIVVSAEHPEQGRVWRDGAELALDGELTEPEEWVRDAFLDFVEPGCEILSAAYHEDKVLYRLSAPGYMDCTDWTTDADDPIFDD